MSEPRRVCVGDELVRGYAPRYQGHVTPGTEHSARRAYALEMQQLWLVMELYDDRTPLLGRVRTPREGDGVDLAPYTRHCADYSHLDGSPVVW